MQHCSNYFVQILVIRSKCREGGQRWSRRGEKIPGEQLPLPCTPTSCAYDSTYCITLHTNSSSEKKVSFSLIDGLLRW